MFMYGWMSHWMNVTEWGGVRECDRTLENWNYLNIHRKVTRFRHRPPPNKTKTNFFSNNPLTPPLEKFNDRCNVVLQYLNHHQQTKNSNSLELVYMHVYSKQLSYHLCIKNLFKFLYSVVHIWWGNCKLLCFHKKMNISPTQSKKWGSKQKSQMFLTINIVFMGRRFLISITFTCPCTLQAKLKYVKLNTQMPFYLRWPFS